MSFYAATGSIPFQSSSGQQTDYTGQTGPSATNTYCVPVDLNGSGAVTPWAQYGNHTNGKLGSNPEPAPVETPAVPGAIAHVAGASDVAGQQPQTVQPTAISPVISPARHSDGGKRLDLEQEVQALRKQLAQRHENDQRTLAQVSALTADLAAERLRCEDLGQQLHLVSTAHHALQMEHERLLSAHAFKVREYDHMVSSHAAAARDLEERTTEVARLQRLLDEAQQAAAAAAAAAAASAQEGGEGNKGQGETVGAAAGLGPGGRGTGVQQLLSSGGRADASGRPHSHGSGPSVSAALSASAEERWALRLHKAERALEVERRVSEELRQQLAAAQEAAARGRAAMQRMEQLEVELDSPGGPPGLTAVSSEPGPLQPPSAADRPGLSPMASHPASIYHERLPLPGSSGSFTALGGGTSQRGSMGGIGLASGGGTGGIGAVGAGSSMPGVGLGLPLHHPQHHHRLEEQVAKLKKEIEVLRGDLSRMAVAEEAARVTVRAADDRARAAELVCLDVRRQCDQAARTIGRLIDENSELVTKINSQANALEDYRSGLTRKEADLRELSDRLAHAQQLLATQHQLLGSPTAASGPYTSHGPAAAAGRTSDGASPSGGGHVALDTSALAAAGQGPGHGQQTHGASPAGSGVKGGAQGRGPRSPGPRGAGGRGGEAASDDDVVLVMPGGALTEADWKLVMLTEEVRRLVGEVSLATTARLALELQHRQSHPTAPLPYTHTTTSTTAGSSSGGSNSSAAPDTDHDLPRILSRLEGLAGRRLSAGETAAYIVELAGHMERLEEVLLGEQRKAAELRTGLGQGQQQGAQQGGADGAAPADGVATVPLGLQGGGKGGVGGSDGAQAGMPAFGSFIDRAMSESRQQQQEQLPQFNSPPQPQQPAEPHPVVSPFERLPERRQPSSSGAPADGPGAEQLQTGQEESSGGPDAGAGGILAQRAGFAAAAAAAVAAADAAAAAAAETAAAEAASRRASLESIGLQQHLSAHSGVGDSTSTAAALPPLPVLLPPAPGQAYGEAPASPLRTLAGVIQPHQHQHTHAALTPLLVPGPPHHAPSLQQGQGQVVSAFAAAAHAEPLFSPPTAPAPTLIHHHDPHDPELDDPEVLQAAARGRKGKQGLWGWITG